MAKIVAVETNITENGKHTSAYLFPCPHCGDYVQVAVSDTNCCIFRHGVHKRGLAPVNPHMSKDQCEELVTQDLVYGCCKPFRLVLSDPIHVEACDYI